MGVKRKVRARLGPRPETRLTQENVDSALDRHAAWLRGDPAGVRMNFDSCDLIGFDMRNRDLRGIKMRQAYVHQVDFSGSDMSSSDLSGSLISDSVLAATSLAGADLRHTRFTRSPLGGTNVDGVVWTTADLTRAKLRRSLRGSA